MMDDGGRAGDGRLLRSYMVLVRTVEERAGVSEVTVEGRA
jgi:hypothetical protein